MAVGITFTTSCAWSAHSTVPVQSDQADNVGDHSPMHAHARGAVRRRAEPGQHHVSTTPGPRQQQVSTASATILQCMHTREHTTRSTIRVRELVVFLQNQRLHVRPITTAMTTMFDSMACWGIARRPPPPQLPEHNGELVAVHELGWRRCWRRRKRERTPLT